MKVTEFDGRPTTGSAGAGATAPTVTGVRWLAPLVDAANRLLASTESPVVMLPNEGHDPVFFGCELMQYLPKFGP